MAETARAAREEVRAAEEAAAAALAAEKAAADLKAAQAAGAAGEAVAEPVGAGASASAAADKAKAEPAVAGASASATDDKATAGAGDPATATAGKKIDDEHAAKARLQIKKLFRDLTGKLGVDVAYSKHEDGKLEPKGGKPLTFESFQEIFLEERDAFRRKRRVDVIRRGQKRRDYNRLNAGYEEPEDTYEAEELMFKNEWRNESINEDLWKAEYYQHLYRTALRDVPESRPLATRSDKMADIFAEAYRKHIREANRPVLTNELADFENPYMMKRSALERLLQERCVRNQLDERCMHRLLDRQPDLVKSRATAPLPPEVLEPLAAFRGDVRWSFDAQERLGQKLEGVRAALKALPALRDGGAGYTATDVDAVIGALPENQAVDPNQVPGICHPWRHHLGFRSAVPTGVTGGTKFGQPTPPLEEQVQGMRYPTLQRVAHTLPRDPKWRAHVVRSIRVLERSKDWDFKSKLTAVNKMKEIYDHLRTSAEYTAGFDEKLPLNRVASHLKKKYARDKQYIKTFRKRFLLQKSFTRYRPSLTATAPMKVSPAVAAFKG